MVNTFCTNLFIKTTNFWPGQRQAVQLVLNIIRFLIVMPSSGHSGRLEVWNLSLKMSLVKFT